MYCDIVDELWEKFINEIVHNYLSKYRNNEKINISGIEIDEDRIRFNKKEILFEDLELKQYHHHFMIFSKEDNYNNKMLYYLKDKDAVILFNVLKTIIKDEQLRTKEISDRKVSGA